MVSFREALTNAIRNAYCQALSSSEAFWNQYAPTIGAVPNPGIGAARFAQRLLCNREPPDTPSTPFTGGQCPVLYEWRATGILRRSDGTTEDLGGPTWIGGAFALVGPITAGGFRKVTPPGGGFGYQAFIRNAAGIEVIAGGGTLADDFSLSTTLFQVRTADGSPDNCGDPEIEPPPSNGYNVTNTTINYTDVNNNNVSIPVTLVFAPIAIGNNNLIQVPFTVNVPVDFGLNLNGTINLPDGDINFDFGGTDGVPGSDPCKPPQPDIPDDLPDVPPDVPDPVPPIDPDEIPQVIRGAIVTTSFVPDNTSVYFQDDIPDLYLPRLGNVQFLIEIDGKLAWSAAIDVNNKRQLVLCPWEGGAIRVDGFPRPGIIWDITPVYDLSSIPIPIRPYVQP